MFRDATNMNAVLAKKRQRQGEVQMNGCAVQKAIVSMGSNDFVHRLEYVQT